MSRPPRPPAASGDRPRIRPARWRPPPSPGLSGPYAANDRLALLERLPIPGLGPEDVAVDGQGRVLAGTVDGALLRLSPDGRLISRLAETGGRPLGIEVAPDGDIVVCDAYRGLLVVDPHSGAVRTLATSAAGRRFACTNAADIAEDGSIYFTDSSDLPIDRFEADLLRHRPRGRLLVRRPGGPVEVIADDLYFANGVALAGDGSSVLVAETSAYRITRIWLSGPRAGRSDVVLDGLPGFPDNLSRGSGGIVWVAIPSTRNRILDVLLPRPGVLRRAVNALPARLQPEASRIAFVLGVDQAGTVVHNLQGRGDRYHYVTGVREHDGWLYLGSLAEPAIARIPMTAWAAG